MPTELTPRRKASSRRLRSAAGLLLLVAVAVVGVAYGEAAIFAATSPAKACITHDGDVVQCGFDVP